jgi:thiol:disulfide interchange protein DsbC
MVSTRALTVALLAVLSAFWQPAIAQDPSAKVLAALDKVIPDIVPDRIQPSAIPDLYEVSYGAMVIYVSEDGRHLIQGDMVEIGSGKNYTRERRREHRRESMATVDPDNKVVFGSANAKHTVDVFTDIDCPYCVRLHNQMAEYNRLGIRIRYLAFPRAGPASLSFDKWVAVWCAEDQQSAMGDAKNGRRLPAKKCDNPVAEQFALGRAVGVRGTPSIIFENGRLVPGYVPPEELLEMLEENDAG